MLKMKYHCMIDCRIVGVNVWFVSRSLRPRSLGTPFAFCLLHFGWTLSCYLAPGKELPPWFWERQNVTLRHPSRDAEVEGKHSAQVIIDQHFPKKHRAKTPRPKFNPYSTALFKSDRHCLGTSSNSRSLKNSSNSNLLLCMSRFLPGLVVFLAYAPYRPGSCFVRFIFGRLTDCSQPQASTW